MATLTWVSAAGGFWSSTANWNPAQTPSAVDDVLFNGGGLGLSFVSGATIQSVTLTDPANLLTATGILNVTDAAAIQAGTLAVVSGGNVTLPDLNNLGTITIASGGQVTMTGTYDSDSVERIFGTGGTLTRTGTMLNTGKVFDPSVMGTLSADFFANETIVGGTVLASFFSSGTLDGVTWQGDMTVNPLVGEVGIRNSITMVGDSGIGPGFIDLDHGTIAFSGGVTLDDVLLESGSPSYLDTNALRAVDTFTIGANATVAVVGFPTVDTPHDLTLAGDAPASQIINHGTVEVRTGGGQGFKTGGGHLTISVKEFHNHGLVSALGTLDGSTSFTITGERFVNEVGGLLQATVVDLEASSSGGISANTDFTNDGSVLVSRGRVTINTLVQGSGTIAVQDDGFVDLNSGVLAGQIIALNGSGTVDVAVPQLFQGTITGLTSGTLLHLDSSATAVSYTNNVLTMELGGGQTFGLNIVGSLTLDDFIVNTGTTGTTITTDLPAPCFAAGTLIRTEKGDIAVESLRAGDRIHVESDAEAREVVWIGQRDVDCARHPDPAAVWPVRVTAGAFGSGQPARDLYLSPDHAIFLQDSLIPVKHLLNGATIARVPTDHVTYYHVELVAHAVILAEGLPVESYLDTGDRDNFANAGPVMRLFPVFGADPNLIRDARACAPLVVTGPAVAAARALTASRSAA